jgi:hypothetical protein
MVDERSHAMGQINWQDLGGKSVRLHAPHKQQFAFAVEAARGNES